MKLYFTIILFVFFEFLFSYRVFSQNSLIQSSNSVQLRKLSSKFSENFITKKDKATTYAKQHNIPLLIKNHYSVKELMEVLPSGELIYFTTTNYNAAISSRANTLHTGGILNLNLDGEGLFAYVWDGGVARSTHQEFYDNLSQSRYSLIDSGSLGLSDHATHVTGTIMASGIELLSTGMAPKCNVKGADWDNDLSEVSTEAANGMLISNHSYGLFNTNIPDWWFGAYIDESRNWDLIMNNAPYYLMVCAAGNDGEDSTSNDSPLEGLAQYDKLNGKSCAKNNLVIANSNDANIDQDGNLISVTINTSSSQGPTDDYRIKPDLTGNGTLLYSPISTSDTSYDSYTGTSMATPNVTGTLLLLQQHYFNLYNSYLKAASLKGLALHTADDAGTPGPDVKFGWGLINAKKAAELISNTVPQNSIIQELTLNNGDSFTIGVLSDNVSKLEASISWNDPAGSVNNGNLNNSTPVLVNDLDIRISKVGEEFFPYKLTSVLTSDTGDNIVDPFEKIEIDNASGVYAITVTHKNNLINSSQDYTLIISGIEYNGDCNATVPTGLTSDELIFGTVNLSWNLILGVSGYQFRYKAHQDSNWEYITVTDPNIQLTGLSGSVIYDAQVSSICPDGSQSGFSPIYQFPSNLVSVEEAKLDDIVDILMSDISLEIKSDLKIKRIFLYNELGKSLLQHDVNSFKSKVDLVNLTKSQVFILRIEFLNGKVYYKKIFR